MAFSQKDIKKHKRNGNDIDHNSIIVTKLNFNAQNLKSYQNYFLYLI